MNRNKENIIIYREWLLPYSETFIKEQAENLNNFLPYYFGLKKVNGIPLPEKRVITIDNGNFWGGIRYKINKIFKFSPSLVKEAQKINPKLIHAHFGPDGYKAIKLKRNLNIPLIVTFHGSDATTKKEYADSLWLNSYFKNQSALFKYGDCFIAVSKFIKNKLLEQGFPQDKIIVHYTGVDTRKINYVPNRERNRNVLFVGRIVENKGLKYLIDALEIVQRENPSIGLIVIGDGPLKDKMEQYAREKIKNFIFLGKQTFEQTIQYMSVCKILCVPSITLQNGQSEGLGQVFLEAGAMGTPVVSFLTGGIPEAVRHNHTGLLFPEKDVRQLAEGIAAVFKNIDLWNKLSMNAVKYINQNFNIQKQTQKLEEIYRKIINNYNQ